METPDVTKAQIIALAQAVIATVVAFGVNLSFKQQAVLMGDSAILAGLIVSADVAIRRGRQKHFGASFRLADVADALAKHRPAPVKPAGENVSLAQAQAARRELIGDIDAAFANGPQPEPGTYPADEPPAETPAPQQPAF